MREQRQYVAARESIERLFHGSLLLLILTGFVTLAGTGHLDKPSIALVACALLGRFVLFFGRRTWMLPESWINPLGLLYLIFYLIDLFYLSGNFVTATVHLVLYGMSVKLHSMKRERDYLYLAVLAFLEVLAAAVLTVGSSFLPALAFFLFVATLTFASMEIRRSLQEKALLAPEEPMDSSKGAAGWLTLTSALLLTITLLLGAGIFFVLPRLSYGYMSRLAQQTGADSGYSESVDLGATGSDIRLSSRLVAHLKIEDSPARPTDLRLRGTALTHFDGTRWSAPPARRARLLYERGGVFDLSLPGEPSLWPAGAMRYTVMMEGGEGDTIFLLDTPRQFYGRFREPSQDDDGGVRLSLVDHLPTVYGGVSASAPAAAPGAYLSPEQRESHLQLPPLDPRIAALAREITARASNNREKAVAIDQYLSSRYSYTLALPGTAHKDPLAYFLFERKQGHCEYFASAMAVLLRAAGVPSRVVTGYRGGEYNSVSDSYMLRASNAHAWVEAWLEDSGWTTFDPTPASNAAPAATGWQRLPLYLDAMREYWREWIVNYDFQHQRTLGEQTASLSHRRTVDLVRRGHDFYQSLQAWASRANARLLRHAEGERRALLLTLTLALIVFLLPPLRRGLLRVLGGHALRKHPQQAASLWLNRAEKQLARHGWHRSPSETAPELTERIAEPTVRQMAQEFVRVYEMARFGNSAEAAALLPRLYALLREACRQR
jgi:transglutaminase-like putative cysteine protease